MLSVDRRISDCRYALAIESSINWTFSPHIVPAKHNVRWLNLIVEATRILLSSQNEWKVYFVKKQWYGVGGEWWHEDLVSTELTKGKFHDEAEVSYFSCDFVRANDEGITHKSSYVFLLNTHHLFFYAICKSNVIENVVSHWLFFTATWARVLLVKVAQSSNNCPQQKKWDENVWAKSNMGNILKCNMEEGCKAVKRFVCSSGLEL